MEVWLWVVNGVLWLFAAGLISKGIRRLLSGLKLMRWASVELTRYVISESTEAADEIERWAEGKKQEIRDLMNKAAAEKSEGKIEALKIEALEIELDKGFKKVAQLEREAGQYETVLYDLQGRFEDSTMPTSDAGAQVVKTLAAIDLALSAALFAFASVLVGTSAVLIALF